MRLRDDYVVDCNVGVGALEQGDRELGIPFEIKLPHVAFHRHIGEFSRTKADVDGKSSRDAEWEKRRRRFPAVRRRQGFHRKPDAAAVEPGKFASWIAPPKVGIDNKPGDFEYVKIA